MGRNNLPFYSHGQLYYGRNKNIEYTRLPALSSALQYACSYIKRNSLNGTSSSIALPYGIGAGLGNGNWEDILKEITNISDMHGTLIKLYRKQ